jgi:hypothetical protein
MPQLKPKIREGLVVADFGDELVICEPALGRSHIHYLNPQAALIFRLCDGTGTVHDLASDVAELYGLPVETIEPDIRGMVRVFRRQGMLTHKPVIRRRTHDHGHDHDEHHHDHEHVVREPTDERARIRREVPDNE